MGNTIFGGGLENGHDTSQRCIFSQFLFQKFFPDGDTIELRQPEGQYSNLLFVKRSRLVPVATGEVGCSVMTAVVGCAQYNPERQGEK